jgi:hypothetical protein
MAQEESLTDRQKLLALMAAIIYGASAKEQINDEDSAALAVDLLDKVTKSR